MRPSTLHALYNACTLDAPEPEFICPRCERALEQDELEYCQDCDDARAVDRAEQAEAGFDWEAPTLDEQGETAWRKKEGRQ